MYDEGCVYKVLRSTEYFYHPAGLILIINRKANCRPFDEIRAGHSDKLLKISFCNCLRFRIDLKFGVNVFNVGFSRFLRDK